jgi:hypothetical protein
MSQKTQQEFIQEQIEEFQKEHVTFDDYLKAQEKISNLKYPDRLWSDEFREHVKHAWEKHQDSHKKRVLDLYTKVLIEYYNENFATIEQFNI